MRKSIYIHIGTHKTGTSIIQKTLIKNQDRLKKEGVKYINLYTFEHAQSIMTLKTHDKLIAKELKQFINSHINDQYTKYIICCEYLSGNPKALYANVAVISVLLFKALADFTEKKIFVALREQEQFIQSIFTQYLHQAEDISMDVFLDKTKLSNIKWTNFLKSYQSVFGEENVKCIPYDKKVLESKNLINYFGDFSQINALQTMDLGTVNRGYSAEAMEIAKHCNTSLNPAEQKILRQFLQEHLGKEMFSQYEILNKEEITYLRNFFKNDNQKLFQTYFSEFGIEDYTELETLQKNKNPQNAYIKLLPALIKKINKLKDKNTKLLEVQSKNTISSPKQLLKNQIKRIVKRKQKDYIENIVLKTKFENYEHAVVLGSSSSINKLDITQFSNDFVITVGNFFEHPEIEKINPKIHVFAASHPPITKEVLTQWWTRCNTILPKEVPLLIEKRDKEIAQQVFKDRELFFYSYGGQVPIDFTKPIMSPWSVTIVALQLAIYCKIETIGILGVNHDWQCIKPYTHFYDHGKPSLEYYLHQAGIEISYEKQKQPFPKERLYKEYELYQQYETLKNEAERFGIRMYNYDPFSDFDVFEFDKKNNLIKDKQSNSKK